MINSTPTRLSPKTKLLKISALSVSLILSSTTSGQIRTLPNGMPILNSNPGAAAVIFLDFDGGDAFGTQVGPYGGDDSFNATERQEIIKTWTDISNHFAMFDLNVTTIQPDRKSIPTAPITISPDFKAASSAVRVLGSTRERVNTAIHADGPITYSPAITHELGHALGCHHQGLYKDDGERITAYRSADEWGQGYFMGAAHSGKYPHWGVGFATAGGVKVAQNDIDIITSNIIAQAKTFTNGRYNGDGFRVDDHSGNLNAPSTIRLNNAPNLGSNGLQGRTTGIIERFNDTDVFSFNWPGGNASIKAEATRALAASVHNQTHSSSVTTIMELLNSSGRLVRQNTPTSQSDTDAFIGNIPLSAGTYYIRIRGAGLVGDLGADDLTIEGNASQTTTPITVSGSTEAAAIAAIQASGNTLGTISRIHSPTVPTGRVISQSATTGTINLTISLGTAPSSVTPPKFSRLLVTSVRSDQWKTVNLDQNFGKFIVIGTPIYRNAVSSPPVVTRFKGVKDNRFQIELDRIDHSDSPISLNVSVIVAEVGVYNQRDHGVKMEVVRQPLKPLSTSTNWIAEKVQLNNSYNSPVVVGQVLSYQNQDWSVFWTMGDRLTNPPRNGHLSIGKHIGEDPNRSRTRHEGIGYIVIEAGRGKIGNINYEAGIGPDIVRGILDSPQPYRYHLSGQLRSVGAVALTIAGMDGRDGGWPALSGGNSSMTRSGLNLYILEDELRDRDRVHTTEQVSYLVVE